MIRIRRAEDRGVSDFGWLDSRHSFSFGGYHDAENMGFRSLRVINDDRVVGGAGFGTHGHQDMEIISWVVEGTMAHKDSMGNVSELHAGELQRMTAGTGITHSEFNASDEDPLRFLQIWIIPEERGLEPSWEQRAFPVSERRNEWTLMLSPQGERDSLKVHQSAWLYGAFVESGQTVTFDARADRHYWLQVVTGSATLGSELISEGDGVAMVDVSKIEICSDEPSDFLLFELT